jgi:hypothetical protein
MKFNNEQFNCVVCDIIVELIKIVLDSTELCGLEEFFFGISYFK